MKNVFLMVSALMMSAAASAETVRSRDVEANIARVVQVLNVATEPVQVNVSVVDMGGSTDVSPTQRVFFNLYLKGEMFSTDAAFDLGSVFSLESVRQVRAGVYELTVTAPTRDYRITTQRYTVDARRAITAIQAVDCEDEFDCARSENFSSTVNLRKR